MRRFALLLLIVTFGWFAPGQAHDVEAQNKAVARSFFEDVLDKGKLEDYSKSHAPDFVAHAEGHLASLEEDMAAAREQRVADHLVAEGTADPRLRGVADVVEVEEQERSALAALQRRLGASDAIVTQAREVDALLVVDAHVPRRGQRRLTARLAPVAHGSTLPGLVACGAEAVVDLNVLRLQLDA